MPITKSLRKYERVAFLCPVTMTVEGGAASEVSSLDISLGGVGLISHVFVGAENNVTLSFRLKNAARQPVVERIRGRVVFARSDIDGHRLGVEFLRPLERSTNPELTRKVESL